MFKVKCCEECVSAGEMCQVVEKYLKEHKKPWRRLVDIGCEQTCASATCYF